MDFEKEYMTSGGEIRERSGKISWRSQDGIWEDDKGFDGQRTGNAILEKANSTSGAPGSGGSEHICEVGSHGMDCNVRYINGNMRERGRLRYLNIMVKIWTLLNSRESLKDLKLEDWYKQAEL